MLSTVASFVTCVTPVPFEFIVHRSVFPLLGVDVNRIFEPSGDHTGNWSAWLFPLFVSWVLPVPSAFMTQTSGPPSLSLIQAILVPSGDQRGSLSMRVLVVRR